MKTQAQKLRETAAKLIKQAEELENGIDHNQCKYGTYTNEPFNTHGCKTCGSPKLVLCSHKKTIADRFSSKYCNPQNCKYFKPCPGIAQGDAGTADENKSKN